MSPPRLPYVDIYSSTHFSQCAVEFYIGFRNGHFGQAFTHLRSDSADYQPWLLLRFRHHGCHRPSEWDGVPGVAPAGTGAADSFQVGKRSPGPGAPAKEVLSCDSFGQWGPGQRCQTVPTSGAAGTGNQNRWTLRSRSWKVGPSL